MTSSATRVNEIKLDIEDLNSLLENASRQKSKDILALEIKKLQSELINMQNQFCSNISCAEDIAPKPIVKSGPKCYDVKLNNYAWDQSDEYVKLYISLDKVGTLPKDAIVCNFLDRSVSLHVLGLENKNYELTINNLCEDVNTGKSSYKVKTNMIIINLAKKSNKLWSCITSVEKRLKEAKTNVPSATDSSDPNESLMSLMKKMYQEGDDEMKKTIAKAWTESQEKKMKHLPDLDL